MKLPVEFTEKMKKLLGESEYEEFVNALKGQRQYGLRVNRLKINVEEFEKISPFQLEPIPWTPDGFYISGEDAPGRHPFYHAGLYYIQEPSAMLPGRTLGALPGEKVLDLCAAPGGKTVQIACDMEGKGLLVSNDINADRVKALVKNIELCGVRNAIVLNESPENLIRNFEGYFDRVIIDAPCSGEGMFRKDEAAVRSWESFKCERCTRLQAPILHSADRLLKPGGTLVYSTCTFSPEENEQMIAEFMSLHEGYELEDIPKIGGIEGGRPQWALRGADAANEASNNATGCGLIDRKELEKAARLWPHRVRGEGHFVAKLIKKNCGRGYNDSHGSKVTRNENVVTYDSLPESFHSFVNENLNYKPEGVYLIRGRNLYNLPESPPALDNLKTAKFGWFLGTFEGGRFEPSHSMVVALEKEAFKRTINLDASGREVNSYLKGETIMLEGEKGLTAVCVNGWTLGWAKQTGDMLKNMYPKGWRRLT